MIILTILAFVISVNAADIPEECDGITVNGVYHEKTILKEGIDRPYILTVDYSSNTLYFSYSLHETDDVFRSSYINLNTNEFGNIEDIPNGFAQAVDQKNHIVYLGGSDGIYKYNEKTKKSEFYAGKNFNIWNLYFNDVLYCINFPTQFLFTVTEDEVKRFKYLEDTKVDQFVIDSDEIMFFTNESGLFGQNKTNPAEKYADMNSIRALTTDINGNPYCVYKDGIYVINKKDKELNKIADIEDTFGLAFDNDNNIIYADANTLVRLKASDKICVKQEKNETVSDDITDDIVT